MFKDLKGTKFGKLQPKLVFFTQEEHLKIRQKTYWICKCDCGNLKTTLARTLAQGNATSCGCTRHTFHYRHGMKGTQFYRIWQGVKGRCKYRHIHPSYKHVNMCDRWLVFENFKDDMYESYLKHRQIYGEENTTIDRIDPHGDYEPSNCRWATRKVQSNNKRGTQTFVIHGEELKLAEIAEKYNVPYRTIYDRLKKWDIKKVERSLAK